MNVEYTPTTQEDVKEFFPRASPWRIKAITVRINGKIEGIGGYAILPNGKRMGFMEASEESCKKYPIVLYRATKKFFDEVLKKNVSRIVVFPDQTRDAAVRWLEFLGFTKIGETEGEIIYQWQRSHPSSA